MTNSEFSDFKREFFESWEKNLSWFHSILLINRKEEYLKGVKAFCGYLYPGEIEADEDQYLDRLFAYCMVSTILSRREVRDFLRDVWEDIEDTVNEIGNNLAESAENTDE